MNEYQKYQLINQYKLEAFLIDSIIVLGTIAFIIILLTLLLRIIKIRRDAIREQMQRIVDDLLSEYMFGNSDNNRILRIHQRYVKSRIFRACFVGSLIKLHQVYLSQYKHRIKKLYIESGMAKIAYTTIEQSKKWHKITAAIYELSQLDAPNTKELFIKQLSHRNSEVRKSAIVALFKQIGSEALHLAEKHNIYIDPWHQDQLMYHAMTIKNLNLSTLNNYALSPNQSVRMVVSKITEHHSIKI